MTKHRCNGLCNAACPKETARFIESWRNHASFNRRMHEAHEIQAANLAAIVQSPRLGLWLTDHDLTVDDYAEAVNLLAAVE
jgi:hypothetical protein